LSVCPTTAAKKAVVKNKKKVPRLSPLFFSFSDFVLNVIKVLQRQPDTGNMATGNTSVQFTAAFFAIMQ
jgi:hypothetical protein